MKKKMDKKNYEIDMCNGPILGKMLLFTIPLMFSSILQILFNAADVIVVGRFAGDNSLAAVGSTTSIIALLTNLFIGLSVGANVLVARYYGAAKKKELSETVHTAMLLSAFSGIILTIVGCIGVKQILVLMSTPEEVLPLAVLYLRIYFLGMTATMIYNFGSAILRAVGDTQRPLYYLIVAGIINVSFNLLFVIVFRMGVAGVATATVISQSVSAFLVVRCLIHEESGIRLEIRQLHLDYHKFINILKIGLPAGFQGIVFSLSNVVIQSSVNSFGAIVVAGNSSAANIEGFVYFAMNAFYQASLSFTSQNVGAGKNERIGKVALCSQACVIIVGLVLGNAVVIFGRPLLGIYSSNEAVIEAGMTRLSVIARTYALCGMMDVMVGSLRGMGYSVMPMIVSLIGACGLRILFVVTLFQIPALHSISALYFCYPVTWAVTFGVHLICYLWAKRRLLNKNLFQGVINGV